MVMETPTTKSEATYSAIVQAGYDMAAAEGIGKVSLGEIAKRLGLSKSGVFSRVGSLEALQEAVLDEYDRRFAQDIFLPSLRLPQGLPRLTVQIQAWIQRCCETGPRTGCLYTAGAFEFDDLSGPLRDRIEQGVLRWRASLRKTVLQAVEVGHLRPDTDPEQLVFEIYCLIVGLLHDARFMRDPSTLKRISVAYGRLISTYKSFTYQD